MDGRRYRASLELTQKPEGTGFALFVPRPGVVRHLPAPGTTLAAGAIVGELEVLGVLHALVVPRGASGAITFIAGLSGPGAGPGASKRAKVTVEAGQKLLVLDPSALSASALSGPISAAASDAMGLVFRAPLGGRYYARPSPAEPTFVSEGTEIGAGQTVALLEVMKTFNRVRYAALDGLPERARVLRVIPKDGDDVMGGDPLLELEAV
jgi:acetyl-CoA carboxylase biotin carboxyl carrier protein